MSRRFAVLQLIDTLEQGGAERIAVNIANDLVRRGHRSFLCTTRRDGPLSRDLDPAVGRLCLDRKSRLDLVALKKLARFIAEHDIDVVHAHGSALFVSVLATLRQKRVRVIWHDHRGLGIYRHNRSPLAYRILTKRIDAVLAVSEPLAHWSRSVIHVPAARVHYVPNFILPPRASAPVDLPGVSGRRIACVANFRAPKDHETLLAAMHAVIASVPDAHLLLVGAESDPSHVAHARAEIARGLAQNVTVLGQRFDVPAILAQSDIGVSSSRAEGMPLAVLEYGASNLAVVASDVGQCAEVLDDGRAGVVVPPGDSPAMAQALIDLLLSPARRLALASALQSRVQQRYDLHTGMNHILAIYRAVA